MYLALAIGGHLSVRPHNRGMRRAGKVPIGENPRANEGTDFLIDLTNGDLSGPRRREAARDLSDLAGKAFYPSGLAGLLQVTGTVDVSRVGEGASDVRRMVTRGEVDESVGV